MEAHDSQYKVKIISLFLLILHAIYAKDRFQVIINK